MAVNIATTKLRKTMALLDTWNADSPKLAAVAEASPLSIRIELAVSMPTGGGPNEPAIVETEISLEISADDPEFSELLTLAKAAADRILTNRKTEVNVQLADTQKDINGGVAPQTPVEVDVQIPKARVKVASK